MSEFLSRDAILGAADVQFEEVDVPEWGGKVRIKGLTAGERDRFEASIIEGRGKNTRVNHRNMRAKLLALTIVDAEGRQVFDQSDIQALGQKSARAINRCFDVAQKLSGVSDEDVDELTKNSDSDQSDDSFSA